MWACKSHYSSLLQSSSSSVCLVACFCWSNPSGVFLFSVKCALDELLVAASFLLSSESQRWTQQKAFASDAFPHYLITSSLPTPTQSALLSVRADISIAGGWGFGCSNAILGRREVRAVGYMVKGRLVKGDCSWPCQCPADLLRSSRTHPREEASPGFRTMLYISKCRGICLPWNTLDEDFALLILILFILPTCFKWCVPKCFATVASESVTAFCILSRAGNFISFISSSFVLQFMDKQLMTH